MKKILTSALFITACLQPAHAEQALGTSVSKSLPMELEKPEEDVLLEIVGYEVDGLDEKEHAEIQRITSIYTGTNKSYEDISHAAAAVTRYMQKVLGYYVGSAYIPSQSPNNKIIKLQAMKGHLAEVKIEIQGDDSHASYEKLIKRRLSSLKEGDILHTKNIERAALLSNDIGGLNLSFSISPGKSAGTVNIKITGVVNNKNKYQFSVDSFGNHSSGRYRLTSSANKHGLVSAGDQIRLELKSSYNADFKLAALGYERPLFNTDWNLGTVIAHVRWQGDSLFGDSLYTSEGQASILGAYGIYPWLRSRNVNAFAILTYQHKDFLNEFSFAPRLSKHSNSFSAGLIGDFRDGWAGGAISTYNLQLTTGSINSEDTASAADTRFNKATWNLSRLQNIYPQHLQWYVKFQGQASRSRLDNSEYFIAAGDSNVRAIGSGLAAGDKGYLVTNELRWFPNQKIFGDFSKDIRLSIFHDWARVKHTPLRSSDNHFTDNYSNNKIISGYGIGFVREAPNSFSLNVNVAWRKHQNFPSLPQDSSARFNVFANKRF